MAKPMKNRLFTQIKMALAAAAVAAGVADCHALEGSWRGELDLQQAKLPLVFNFTESADGTTSCTLDSPMQGAKGIATEMTYCDADSVAIEIKIIGASYCGRVTSSGINGNFSQRGMSFPLTLTKELSLEERRPQTPRPPFPYTSADTTFTSADGTLLAGTFTMPDKAAKGMPMVVMVTGSGPQNRDEELFDHRPFAVIADWLARQGIASFRYDDRGTARSAGDFRSADIDTFKSDASAALAFAKTLNPNGKTGILGHSEGGTIAVMLAAEGQPDFIVSLAGAMTKGKDLILGQNLHTLKNLQLTDRQISDASQLISMAFDDIIAGKKGIEIPIDKYIAERNLEIHPMVMASLRQNLSADSGNYFRQLLGIDASESLKSVKCPVLALNGDFDRQVNCAENLDVVRKYLPKARVKAYPGLNHLFQHAATGEVSEYINIPETISPEVLDDIVAFILSL